MAAADVIYEVMSMMVKLGDLSKMMEDKHEGSDEAEANKKTEP